MTNWGSVYNVPWYNYRKSITEIVLPEGLTSIGSCAFAVCKYVTSVTIPSSVTSIGRSAFEDCSGLTSVTIPSSVTSVGRYAFYGCSRLKEVIFSGSAPSIENDAFQGVIATVYYPADHGWAEEKHQNYGGRLSWVVGSATVSFEANGGNVSISEKSVMYGTPYGELPLPERTGYTFSGWFTASDGGEPVTAETIVRVTVNHTLYANWTVNSYNVTFDANGGTVSNASKIVSFDSSYGSLPIPDNRVGYTFQGWYTEADGGEQVNENTVVQIAEDHTIYAHWTAKSYTVSFRANGGSVSTSSKIVEYGSAYGELPIPEHTGYTFTGWYTSSSEGTKVTEETLVQTAGDHTLYAHWTANEYTVCFEPNGGSVSTEEMTVIFDQYYGTLPTPERTGYSFTGWYTAEGNRVYNSTYVRTAEDHTLYAQWAANQYRVRYNANGGYATYGSIYVNYGENYGQLSTAGRTGYTFAGWFTAAEGGEEITAETPMLRAEDHEIYAHWTANEYIISFDPNGGRVDLNSKTVTYDGPYGNLPVPELEGYIFTGWYTGVQDGDRIAEETVVNFAWDHILYAHWTPNVYTIHYDGNGGTEVPADQEKTHDATLTLSEDIPTHADTPAPGYVVTLVSNGGVLSESTLTAVRTTSYTFINWNTDADGSGTSYEPGAEYSTEGDATLYAQWTSSTATAPVKLPIPTKEGCTFRGWALRSSAKSGFTGEYIPSGNVMLYATWIENEDTAGTLSLGKARGRSGSEIVLKLDLDQNPGIMMLNFRLDYDTDKLQFLGGQDGSLRGWTFSSDGSGAIWDSDWNSTATGTIAELHFLILDTEEECQTKVYLTNISAGNYAEEEIEFAALAGIVTISERVPGDANGDGQVTGMDLIRLRKYLAGDNVEIDLSNADVNGDGKVTGMDLIRLRKYLAGADVELQ